MNILKRVMGAFTEKRSTRDPYFNLWNQDRSWTGTHSAEGIATVLGCISVPSQTLASLPLQPYTSLADGSRVVDFDSPLYPLLHDRPNPYHSPFEFKEAMVASYLLSGNAFAAIETDANGFPKALYPLNPHQVTVEKLPSGRLRYQVRHETGTSVFLDSEMVHIRYRLDPQGILGLSPITLMRHTLGIALEHQIYEESFYRNGLKSSGVVHSDKILTKDQREQMMDGLSRWHSGHNRFRILMLDAGFKFGEATMNHHDAEFIKSKEINRQDIAMCFRVPLSALGIVTDQNYSSLVEESRSLATHCISPNAARIEQALNRSLLTDDQRLQRKTIAFNLDGLLRADMSSRYAAYATGISNGFLKVNEARSKENLPSDPAGDTLRIQMNTQALGADNGAN